MSRSSLIVLMGSIALQASLAGAQSTTVNLAAAKPLAPKTAPPKTAPAKIAPPKIAPAKIGLAPKAVSAAKPVSTPKPATPQPRVAVVQAIPIPRTAFLSDMDAEFSRLDGNRDGIVTRLELEAAQSRALAMGAARKAQQLFAQVDVDRNGQISPAEFTRAMSSAPGKPNAAPLLAQYDGNHDGSISLVEYRTVTLTNFDRMDSDKDGVVTVAEQRAAGILKR